MKDGNKETYYTNKKNRRIERKGRPYGYYAFNKITYHRVFREFDGSKEKKKNEQCDLLKVNGQSSSDCEIRESDQPTTR